MVRVAALPSQVLGKPFMWGNLAIAHAASEDTMSIALPALSRPSSLSSWGRVGCHLSGCALSSKGGAMFSWRGAVLTPRARPLL